jgi:hypothetical protein
MAGRETHVSRMTSRREKLLAERLEDHRAAVREFVERATRVGEVGWLRPRADGKWTPAQETKHVILSYDVLLNQLNGGAPMRVRTKPLRRLLARIIGLGSILYRKRIPVAVNAARELRPEWEAAPASVLVVQLGERAARFEALLADRWYAAPDTRLTHYIFGQLTLDQSVQVMSVHTRHHAGFLPRQ